jgi:hypothetical protein
MGRELTAHKVNKCNDGLQVMATDEPGPGGACHEYSVTNLDGSSESFGIGETVADIKFQNGPIPKVGVNGLTNEVLLTIVEDRLAGFQSGPFVCDENAAALMHTRAALTALKRRTEARLARGVEGTHTV